jgi:hypothetical protein
MNSQMDGRLKSHTHQLSKINDEIRRLNTQVKTLRELRKIEEIRLYQTMKTYNIDKFEGYSKANLEKKCEPKENIKKRTAKEKKIEAINLFRKVGIPDPDSFWLEYKKTQKTIIN